MAALQNRVLDAAPVKTLDDYAAAGGGKALGLARKAGPEGVIGAIERSGLRGRGGAGFPTGTKWRTVSESRSASQAATVVVNAAEGEPGSFKDREILRRNPYKVLEGALVAAAAVGADAVIVAMKASFTRELARMREAIDEVRAAGWADGVELMVVEGPSHYLYGEETALLEVIAGRNPFPRIAPPFRHGVDETGATPSRRPTRPWPGSAPTPRRRRPWSTTPRPSPTCPPSWSRGRSGSGSSAPTSHPAPSSARSPAAPASTGWASSPWARRCGR